MSLDVYLIERNASKPAGSGIFVRQDGQMKEISREEWDEQNPGIEPMVFTSSEDRNEVYWANITHNLSKMAKHAGIYQHLWRPDEIGVTVASQLSEPLKEGLIKLLTNPEEFKELNPSNGWGTYEGLVQFVTNYLIAIAEHPNAIVEVSR